MARPGCLDSWCNDRCLGSPSPALDGAAAVGELVVPVPQVCLPSAGFSIFPALCLEGMLAERFRKLGPKMMNQKSTLLQLTLGGLCSGFAAR